ncbi:MULTISPECIES: PTS sugar transporter subunit IIA [unclassified Oceanispirochaeta]|uniref:PTS sugar transporter subunit IIA n=1 Tax=unclassified Oceanispirochaeta TaxID=2635722 RepID=UPI000E08DDB1|nr:MULTISPECIES: PTS sugar transporter subunit IIA [unclassified Oceanispirochaeta]MBF9016179.1 PTS sugar transporter subunit IIA [Oceanispirochaeta sp. M2]NPD72641.1 PTS sugar transporter subunit IIA [Oceanispirochaeta sp. M1]RDG31791.1 PTS sugar transporter subunit IIA [Oceanispirochaeta sp. M1]
MPLTELLNENNIIISLKSCDRDSVIREMVEYMSAASYVQNAEIVIKSILDRETMGSTGLDKGIAVPHTRTHEVSDLCVALGISSDGVDYNALDGEDSRLFFMILAPPDQSSQHIRILSEIAGISRNKEMLNSLLNAQTVEDVLNQFRQ